MGFKTKDQANINNYNKTYALYRKFAVSVGVFFFSFFIAGTFSPVLPSSALTCTDGSISDPGSTSASVGDICNTSSTTVSVNIENPAYLTITSSASSSSGGSGGISLDYTKEGSPNLGSLITASDTVTTTSNTGQTKYLYISTSSSSNNLTNPNTDLSNDKTFIPAGGGDTLAGATALSDNTWGFSLESSNTFTKVPTIGNEILIQEGSGSGNTTGEYENVATIYYGALATTDLYAGSYFNTIRYTAYMEDTAKAEPMERITYMQDMTGDICANTKVGTATRLIDKRGRGNAGTAADASYGVLKAADGNCWMTDNLDLYNKELSYEDSDFTTGTFQLPESSNWETNDYSQQLLHVVTADSPSNISGDKKVPYIGQVYYNWCSAVALINCSTTVEQNQSICPKNWKLPRGGTGTNDTATNASWPKLINTYKTLNDGSLTGEDLTTTNTSAVAYPLGFRLYYGRWNYGGKSEQYQGSDGFFWSGKPYDDYGAYDAYYSSSKSTNPFNHNNKGSGRSVRCVVPAG